MLFQRETGVCDGRGFSGDGFMAKFKRWIVDGPEVTPVPGLSGGPEWFIIDDQSGAGTDPYIVISRFDAATVSATPNKFDPPHKIARIMLPTATSGRINIDWYLWWNDSTNTGYGWWASHYINTLDAGEFQYDFRGGEEIMCIGAAPGGVWNFNCIGDWDGDVRFVEGPSVAAPISASVILGTSKILTFASQVEAENFVIDNYYFLGNFDGVETLDYCKVTATNYPAFQVTVDELKQDHAIGAVMSAYQHRYSVWSTNNPTVYPFYKNVLPYASRKSSAYAISNRFGKNGTSCIWSSNAKIITINSPNDVGDYASEEPFAVEEYFYGNAADMNRAYGPMVKQFLTSSNGMTQMTTGRTIDSLNYRYVENGNEFGTPWTAVLIPDWDDIS